jgi:glucosamine-6-phosphate deaminase
LPFKIEILSDEETLAARAAEDAAASLRERLAGGGRALVMFATGASQFGVLEKLTAADGIDWSRVDLCHLDEYVGLAPDHPASFVRYLRERVAERVPLGSALFIDGEADPQLECARLKRTLAGRTADLALVGIGENGHLAFNDPPADFTTTEPYIVVELDEACRKQQVGEGCFADIEAVPRQAISASISFILSARRIVCSVPGARKAVALRACLAGPVAPEFPASALRRHNDATVYLDRESAFFLPEGVP